MRENDFGIVSFSVLHVLTRHLDISEEQMPWIRESHAEVNVGARQTHTVAVWQERLHGTENMALHCEVHCWKASTVSIFVPHLVTIIADAIACHVPEQRNRGLLVRLAQSLGFAAAIQTTVCTFLVWKARIPQFPIVRPSWLYDEQALEWRMRRPKQMQQMTYASFNFVASNSTPVGRSVVVAYSCTIVKRIAFDRCRGGYKSKTEEEHLLQLANFSNCELKPHAYTSSLDDNTLTLNLNRCRIRFHR